MQASSELTTRRLAAITLAQAAKRLSTTDLIELAVTIDRLVSGEFGPYRPGKDEPHSGHVPDTLPMRS